MGKFRGLLSDYLLLVQVFLKDFVSTWQNVEAEEQGLTILFDSFFQSEILIKLLLYLSGCIRMLVCYWGEKKRFYGQINLRSNRLNSVELAFFFLIAGLFGTFNVLVSIMNLPEKNSVSIFLNLFIYLFIFYFYFLFFKWEPHSFFSLFFFLVN